MSLDRFQGDPKIYLTQNGATLNFKGGQPVMDSGLENQAVISLFTAPNWWGNALTIDENKKIGSTFEKEARGTITLQKLGDIEKSANKALKSPAFGDINTTVINPISSRIDMNVTIKPPFSDEVTLQLSANGQNWQNQALQDLRIIPVVENIKTLILGIYGSLDNNVVYTSTDNADYTSNEYLI